MLRASIEAEIIATKLIEGGRIYEAIIVYLSLARLVMQVMYEIDDKDVGEILNEIVNDKILVYCRQFFNEVKSRVGRGRKVFGANVPQAQLPAHDALSRLVRQSF